jgi:serine/threonine-protein kinase
MTALPEQIHEVRAELADSFDVIRMLGRGSMGAVYLAFDRRLQRWVALKRLLPEFAGDTDLRERFRREALTNARLAHPGIVPIHALVEAGPTMYSVMRYVPGRSLAYTVWRRQPLPPLEACHILADLAAALDYAHRQRVVHRDIKPENILMDDESGRPMITDFGIARAVSLDAMHAGERRAERGMIYGTARFMSPEQAAGEPELDGRSDLYSLGVLGYALLSGTLPFDGDSLLAIAAQHVSAAPPPLGPRAPGVADGVIRIIMRCLAKSPADRWADGHTLRDALVSEGIHPGELRPRGALRLVGRLVPTRHRS